ncbi:hypothetical protein LSH36_982g00095 [Paralvinella palmiformis]|uniref:Uncharacterized protein n=1 Tax=Paralvinella palmiformis TaxID=53620 RepID=A0AAD9MTB5_9ANNE|nr:hypothetical protein LSH36_982g00095 [Paralvinella palmiformis]
MKVEDVFEDCGSDVTDYQIIALPHRSPYTTPEHVDVLLASYGSRSNQKIAAQTELKYHKHVLALTYPVLKITGSLL